MRYFILLCLLPAHVFGQSIVVSGKHSIVASGSSNQPSAAVVMPAASVIDIQSEIDKLRKEIDLLKESYKSIDPKPAIVHETGKIQSAIAQPKTTQWYLVSEDWCIHCKPRKERFLKLGWPISNVITRAQCQQKFGFMPATIPYEFAEPTSATNAASATVHHPQSSKCTCSSACTCGCQSGSTCKCSQTTHSVVQLAQPTVNRYYNYKGRSYDLETYSGCSMRNCGMCAEILAARQRYLASRQLINKVDDVGPQASSPEDVVDEAFNILKLNTDSVLWDAGCGNGKILISAVQKFGCKAIGVEIDPAKVIEAKHNVDAAGLSDHITILEGDVRNFDVKKHKVTHIYAYLYPDLLAEIADKLMSVDIAVCPGHECPGIGMKLVGQCWVTDSV